VQAEAAEADTAIGSAIGLTERTIAGARGDSTTTTLLSGRVSRPRWQTIQQEMVALAKTMWRGPINFWGPIRDQFGSLINTDEPVRRERML